MCGFCCYFHFDRPEGFPDLDLDTSLQYIHHRGPDAKSKYVSPDGRCALGHTRLSIIDLSGGQQPLSSQDGSIVSVVNGELYDFERIRSELEAAGHKFKTKSDSEIALHLYEDYSLSFLEHLRGEFAVCIWDSNKKRFIAARDRYGIKPLYYTVINGTLMCASEIKSFIPLGWKPEWDVDSIMNQGPLVDYRTCFKNVYKLPPAHYLVAKVDGTMDIRAYWDADYPDKNIPDTRTVPEMIQGVRERLVEAIRLRLRADVPCGVYLSGGIDSSCIAGIASEILKETDPNARLRAFSIAFAGSDKYDESQIAERTAEFCDADFQKLSLTEDDLLSNFEESIWYVEQPHFNLNGVGKFLLSGLVREQGYKVVLTGEGSDEHFAGYAFFHADLLREADLTTPNGFGTVSNKRRLELFDNVGKSSEFEKYTDSRFDRLKVEENTATRRLANNTSFHTVLSNASALNYDYYNKQIFEHYGEPNPGMTMAEAVSGIARGKANSKWHPLHTSLYIENHTFLPNYLCNHLGDRSEMAHSVEARTPFLDHHFTEYVNSLPPSVKIKIEDNGALNEKWILKEAVKPYITEEMYNRTKHPFVAPGSKGRSESIVKLMNKLVTQEKLEKLGWVNVESLLIAKEEFLEKGDPTLFKDLLGIMSYVVLADRFNVAPYTRFNTGTVVR